jgi:hypothetical protein
MIAAPIEIPAAGPDHRRQVAPLGPHRFVKRGRHRGCNLVPARAEDVDDPLFLEPQYIVKIAQPWALAWCGITSSMQPTDDLVSDDEATLHSSILIGRSGAGCSSGSHNATRKNPLLRIHDDNG